MEELTKIFNNRQFGVLEVVLIGGKEFFPATDVAKMLGYTNPHKAVLDHCKADGVTFREGVSETENQYGTVTYQKVQKKYINEGNLYRLITHSKLPAAEKFESWVFDEVIPDIRRTGMYGMSTAVSSDAAAMSSEMIAKIVAMTVTETIRQMMPLISKKQEPVRQQVPSEEVRIRLVDVSCPQTSGKMEGFPEEIRNEVDKLFERMTEQQSINFSYVARFCTVNGFPITSVGVKRYYERRFHR